MLIVCVILVSCKSFLLFGIQAFGVGAFEDDDSNIYTDYDLTQYDYSIGNEDELTPQVVQKTGFTSLSFINY